jgi:hypothetical protein
MPVAMVMEASLETAALREVPEKLSEENYKNKFVRNGMIPKLTFPFNSEHRVYLRSREGGGRADGGEDDDGGELHDCIIHT